MLFVSSAFPYVIVDIVRSQDLGFPQKMCLVFLESVGHPLKEKKTKSYIHDALKAYGFFFSF